MDDTVLGIVPNRVRLRTERLGPGELGVCGDSNTEHLILALEGELIVWVETEGTSSPVHLSAAGPSDAVFISAGGICRYRAVRTAVIAVGSVGVNSTFEQGMWEINTRAVPIEWRGHGPSRRAVQAMVSDDIPASSMIAGLTRSGGGVWSSFPPHRHDRSDIPLECEHQEAFLVRISPPSGFAVLIFYDEDGGSESARVIHDGDIVNVARGFHSLVVAADHEMSYLWVMGGPDREQHFRCDSRYGWIVQ